jgi:hypothetical protein
MLSITSPRLIGFEFCEEDIQRYQRANLKHQTYFKREIYQEVIRETSDEVSERNTPGSRA